MPQEQADGAPSRPDEHRSRLAIPPLVFTGLVIASLTAAGIGARYGVRGDFDVIHGLLILFFSINLVICHWEICLFLRRDYIEKRVQYWRERREKTGRTSAVEFLTGSVPLRRILSSETWADVWATYSQFDSSYADRRTYGYNVDIANGLVTPLPMLLVFAAFTVDFLPALVAGIVGAMMFWQLTYATSVYLVSFFVAGRQRLIGKRDVYIYIWALNCPWVLFPLLGLYVSIRLIVDGDYGVLGY